VNLKREIDLYNFGANYIRASDNREVAVRWADACYNSYTSQIEVGGNFTSITKKFTFLARRELSAHVRFAWFSAFAVSRQASSPSNRESLPHIADTELHNGYCIDGTETKRNARNGYMLNVTEEWTLQRCDRKWAASGMVSFAWSAVAVLYAFFLLYINALGLSPLEILSCLIRQTVNRRFSRALNF